MRIIVAGGRKFANYRLLAETVDSLFEYASEGAVIISGGAKGADRLGEIYASSRGFVVEKFPADWDKYGKSAGYRRNEQMAEVATHLVAFWDGESKGTGHMIDIAARKGLDVTVIIY